MLCLCLFFSSCRVIIMLNVTVLDKAEPIGNPSNIQQVGRPPEPLCLRALNKRSPSRLRHAISPYLLSLRQPCIYAPIACCWCAIFRLLPLACLRHSAE